LGIYDGELVAAGRAGRAPRSYDVKVLENASTLSYHLFDLLECEGTSLLDIVSLRDRRELLRERVGLCTGAVELVAQIPVETVEDVLRLANEEWSLDREGLVLKSLDGVYRAGKRLRDWQKLKKRGTAVCTIIGFEDGLMGPTSSTVVRAPDGTVTAVKWKDFELLKATRENPDAFIGRELQIEFHERTPDGSFRSPRWDHLVESAEE
jgi:ATP-dependent DNA ligase